MLTSVFVALAATLFSVASAQTVGTGNMTITVGSVDLATRISWCTGQKSTCSTLCGGGTTSNNCIPESLNWTCTCSTGNMPNVSDYTPSVPSYICMTWQGNCINAHPDDAAGQALCNSVTCGKKSVADVSSPSSSASTSASASAATGSASVTPSGTQSSTVSPTATQSGAAVALSVAQQYGTGILATGLLALFGLVL